MIYDAREFGSTLLTGASRVYVKKAREVSGEGTGAYGSRSCFTVLQGMVRIAEEGR